MTDILLIADLRRRLDEIGHTHIGQDITASIDVIIALDYSLNEIREENDRLKGEKSLHSADAKTAWAECDELRKAIDSAEIEHGLTSEGNLWRFWSAKAKELAAKNAELEADEQRALDLCAAAVDDYNNALASCEAMHRRAQRAEGAVAAVRSVLDGWEATLKHYGPQLPAHDLILTTIKRGLEKAIARSALAEYRKETGE